MMMNYNEYKKTGMCIRKRYIILAKQQCNQTLIVINMRRPMELMFLNINRQQHTAFNADLTSCQREDLDNETCDLERIYSSLNRGRIPK